jgi:hypothetical protein
MLGDKVFQTMVFSRHMQEASHCYENFGLEWSFKYSKNTMVSSKLWYSKQSFLHANQTPHWKKYHGIIPRGPRPNVHKGNFTYKSLYKGETTKGKYKTYVSLTPPFKLKVDQPY